MIYRSIWEKAKCLETACLMMDGGSNVAYLSNGYEIWKRMERCKSFQKMFIADVLYHESIVNLS